MATRAKWQHHTPTVMGIDHAVSGKVSHPESSDMFTETVQGSGLQEDMNDGSLPGSMQEPVEE